MEFWLGFGAWLAWLLLVAWLNLPFATKGSASAGTMRLQAATCIAGVSVLAHGCAILFPLLAWHGTFAEPHTRGSIGVLAGVGYFALLWPFVLHARMFARDALLLRGARLPAVLQSGAVASGTYRAALWLGLAGAAAGLGVFQAHQFEEPGIRPARDELSIDDARTFTEHSLVWFGEAYDGLPLVRVEHIENQGQAVVFLYRSEDASRRLALEVKSHCETPVRGIAEVLPGGARSVAADDRVRIWSADIVATIDVLSIPAPPPHLFRRLLLPLNDAAVVRLRGWPPPTPCEEAG
jgi:hypothetical protein